MARLDEIQDGVSRIWAMVSDLIEGELDFDAEVPDDPVTVTEGQNRGPRMNRTQVEVRTGDGTELVPWTEIDERIIEAVRLASEMRQPWELYRDAQGKVRVTVSEQVMHRYRKAHTYQQPVPTEGGGIDALDQARAKE